MRRHIITLFTSCLPLMVMADVPVKIAHMMDLLPCKPTLQDTIMTCPQLSQGISISIEHDRCGDLSHLGLNLYTPEMKSMSNHTLCNCVERIMLELMLQPSDNYRTKLISEYKMRLTLDGFPLGSTRFSSFKQCLKLFSVSSETSIKELEDGYEFRLMDDETTLTLFFPKDREIIFGTDKKEQDELITERLALGADIHLTPKQPNGNLLKPSGISGMYKSAGKPFLIEQMRSDIYYSMQDGNYSPVFDRKYPLQSYTNLLLGQIARPNFVVDLTHKRYGLTPPRFNVDWASLFNTLVTEKTECFAAARLIDNDTVISGVLVIFHESYGYIDMLTVNVPVDHLFNEKAPELKAYLFTNVPQNNILNLFE